MKKHLRISEFVRSHYEPRISRYKKNYQILDWEDPLSHEKRFQVLLDNVTLTGKSLIDVGCGLGDLFGYLKAAGMDVNYTGIDILGQMINAARERYPEGVFMQGNIFTENPFRAKHFDIVFCSGIFNLNLGDNVGLLNEALGIFFKLAREAVVFNLLDEGSPDKDNRYYYFSQDQVKALVKPYSWKVKIIRGYLPNDFTVLCRRKISRGSL